MQQAKTFAESDYSDWDDFDDCMALATLTDLDPVTLARPRYVVWPALSVRVRAFLLFGRNPGGDHGPGPIRP
jgi:hypothetical protein